MRGMGHKSASSVGCCLAWILGFLLLACLPMLRADAVRVVEVATPAELRRAMDSGAAHVHVTAHLDLTTLNPSPGRVSENAASSSQNLERYFDVNEQLQSLTVRIPARHGSWPTCGRIHRRTARSSR